MALNTGNNPEVVKTSLDEVFYTEYDYPVTPGVAQADNALLLRQGTTDRQAVILAEYEPPGKFEETVEEGEPVIATVRTANKTTYTVQNFKKNLKIPREFYDDDLHQVIENSVRLLGRRARTTQDETALQTVYPDGFGTTTTPDAAYVWSDSHTALDGTTIDNLETGSMTTDNLETLFKKLIEQKAQDGEIGGHNAAALLVPPALFPDANEFLKSELKANVTDNNLNYFSAIWPGVQIFQSPFVGSAYSSYTNADTAHYLVSRNHGLSRWVREPLYTELISWIYDDYDRWTYKAGYREKVGAATWEGAVASTGAA